LHVVFFPIEKISVEEKKKENNSLILQNFILDFIGFQDKIIIINNKLLIYF